MRAGGRCTVRLATTRGSRRRMRRTDFCFPTTSTTSTRVSSIPVMVAGLSPDAPTGERAFHDATFRFGGPLDSVGERSLFVHRPTGRTSDASVASPADARVAFAGASLQRPPRPLPPPSVKRNDFRDPRHLPSSGDLALVPCPVSVTGTPGAAFCRSRWLRRHPPVLAVFSRAASTPRSRGFPCELDAVHALGGPRGIRAEHASLIRTSPVRLLQFETTREHTHEHRSPRGSRHVLALLPLPVGVARTPPGVRHLRSVTRVDGERTARASRLLSQSGSPFRER